MKHQICLKTFLTKKKTNFVQFKYEFKSCQVLNF